MCRLGVDIGLKAGCVFEVRRKKFPIREKGLRKDLFLKWTLFLQPAFNFAGTVLGFPFFQRLVIAAFSFNHFTGVRVLVDLELARLALAGRRGRC